MKNNASIAALLLVVLMFGLQACGLKGDLYLEQPEDSTETPEQSAEDRAALDAGLDDRESVDSDPLDTPDDALDIDTDESIGTEVPAGPE